MSKTAMRKTKIWALIGFMAIFAGLLIFLFWGDNFNILKEIFNTGATKEEIQASISKLGVKAYFVVVVLAMMQVILTFIPAEPLHVVSGISFGLWRGIFVCFIGILIGNTIIYLLHKFFGRKLKDFFATNVNIDFSLVQKSKKIAFIIIILYCLPAIPYGIICFFAAGLGMKYAKYILITAIGSLPSLVLDVGLGHVAMSTSWTVSIIVFGLIVLLLILMYKYKKQIFDKLNTYIKKSQEKAKLKVGEYNPFVYKVGGNLIFRAVRTKVKYKIKNNIKKLEKPCIILCNHGSFYDFIYAGKMLGKNHPHFVVARLYFAHKKLNWVLRKTGAFAKSMFAVDVESSKNCLKVISSGEILAMMPEARLSTVGRFEDIQETTYKFIQKMNVAVYALKINGSYLAKPKWGDKLRRGALVEVELNQLFEKGEAKNLSCEELKTKINTALNYDEWNWLEQHPEIKYKHKTLAVGLENILAVCPKCLQKFSLITKNNNIICKKCGLNVHMDNRYGLIGVEFKNIAQWYDWQTEIIRKEINNNPNFFLQSGVELRHLSTNGKAFTRHAGEGVCRLDRSGLTYIGTDDGKTIEKKFEINSIYRLLFGAGEDFEIYDGKEIYYFVPKEKRSAIMWYIVSGILKENK